jgi:hypothetical protein
MVRRKMSTTVMTSATLRINVNCTSRTDARMLAVASWAIVSVAPTGIARCSFGSSFLMRYTRLDDIGAGLALDIDNNGRHALIKAADLAVLETIDDIGNILEQHRRAVSVRHNDVAIGRCRDFGLAPESSTVRPGSGRR